MALFVHGKSEGSTTLIFMNQIAVSSWVALFKSGSCVQNCQRDASSEHRTAWSEQTEGTREGVEAEAQGAKAKRTVSARSTEKDFSVFSENDGKIGVDKLLGAVLVLRLCSA